MPGSPSLWLELTPRCNLACQFCYNPWRPSSKVDHPVQLPFAGLRDDVERLLDTTRFSYVALSGGEPLLYRELLPLTTWLADQGQRTILTTNGRLLTPAKVLALRSARLDSVQVSLLGAQASTHDRLAGRASWVQAIRAIAASRSAGLPTSATFIATATNLPELPDVVDLVARLGLRYLVVNELQPVGSARLNLDRLDAPTALFDEQVGRARARADVVGVRMSIIRSKSAGDDDSTDIWRRWSVSPDGQLKLCNHASDTLGPISEIGDDRLRAIRHALATGQYEQLAGAVDNCLCFDRALRVRMAYLAHDVPAMKEPIAHAPNPLTPIGSP